MRNVQRFFYENSLTIVFLLFMALSLFGQAYFGWHEHNEFLEDNEQPMIGLIDYLGTGHFIQATFENWESEFLQMALFVILTIFLRQRGSSESKPIGEEDDSDKEPVPSKDAPWAVRKGGIALAMYKHSLSISFIILFLFTFIVHFYGSLADHNEEMLLKGKPPETAGEFFSSSKFWFESFQNWQSEFLAVASIVFLSIYLRQKGSPQSKPVDTPNHKTK